MFDEYEKKLLENKLIDQNRIQYYCNNLNNNIEYILKNNFWKLAQLGSDLQEYKNKGFKLTPEQSVIFHALNCTVYMCLINAINGEMEEIGGVEIEEAFDQLSTWFEFRKGIENE